MYSVRISGLGSKGICSLVLTFSFSVETHRTVKKGIQVPHTLHPTSPSPITVPQRLKPKSSYQPLCRLLGPTRLLSVSCDKALTKPTWRGKCLAHKLEFRTKGSQGRNSEQGLQQRPQGHIACLPWLAQLAFLDNPVPSAPELHPSQ